LLQKVCITKLLTYCI